MYQHVNRLTSFAIYGSISNFSLQILFFYNLTFSRDFIFSPFHYIKFLWFSPSSFLDPGQSPMLCKAVQA